MCVKETNSYQVAFLSHHLDQQVWEETLPAASGDQDQQKTEKRFIYRIKPQMIVPSWSNVFTMHKHQYLFILDILLPEQQVFSNPTFIFRISVVNGNLMSLKWISVVKDAVTNLLLIFYILFEWEHKMLGDCVFYCHFFFDVTAWPRGSTPINGEG